MGLTKGHNTFLYKNITPQQDSPYMQWAVYI